MGYTYVFNESTSFVGITVKAKNNVREESSNVLPE